MAWAKGLGTVLVAGGALWALSATVQASERVALVIGNSDYEKPSVPFLANPRNDAQAMGEALASLGFAVTLLEDAGYQDLRLGLQKFEKAAARSEIAVVFYAGHGIEMDKHNYLVPVDAALASDRDVKHEAMKLSRVLESVEGASRLRLVILDACRNNPFEASMQRTAGTTRSVKRGLARVEPSMGTLVAYAAKEGTTADDEGGKGHSPFTEALLARIETPGLEVWDMFRDVADAVWASTGQNQLPFTYGSVPRNTFYLAGKGPSDPVEDPEDKTPPPPPPGGAKEAYEEAKEVGNVAAMLAVVKRFPGTFEADLAQAWIDKHEQPIVVAGGDPDGIKPGWEVGDTFQDCPECPEMVVVPEGSFMMGSTAGDGDERPVHEVTIARPFAVGVHEVTFEGWDWCVSDGGCGGYRPDDEGWGRGKRPVINVSWNDAKAYVRWLSGRTGKRYRLPSEAEWEYVARAGTKAAYWWGYAIGRNRANCDGCGSRWDDEQTAPVGSFPANPFGLHDVHGNVWEWVEDCGNWGYDGAPSDGSAWESGECGWRVLRGGAWDYEPWVLRSANRESHPSGNRYRITNGLLIDLHGNRVSGFRVARTLTP